jgi:hypothetical protein
LVSVFYIYLTTTLLTSALYFFIAWKGNDLFTPQNTEWCIRTPLRVYCNTTDTRRSDYSFSLSSKWITTTDLFSARHHAFWWEDEVQALRVDGTVSQKRWPEHCYRNIRCMGKLGTAWKWVIASMQRSSKCSVGSRSSKKPFHQRKIS